MVPAPGLVQLQFSPAKKTKIYLGNCDSVTENSVKIERAVLTAFWGGCQVALGHTILTDDRPFLS